MVFKPPGVVNAMLNALERLAGSLRHSAKFCQTPESARQFIIALEVELLIGNPAKAKAKLGWEPSHTLNDLVREMVAADLDTFKKEKHLINSGFVIKSSIEH